MIKTRTGIFAAVGLLLGGVSTAALASVSKPTAEERAACMGDDDPLHYRDTKQSPHRFVPGIEDVPAQPALPGAIR